MSVNGLNIKSYKKIVSQNKPKEHSLLSRLFEKDFFARTKLSNKKKEVFYLELASMLDAGMDIKESIDVIIDQQEKPVDKKNIKIIKEDLIRGFSISDSLKRSGLFTPYEYYCIQIGEESGKLTKVLNQLAQYFNYKLKLKRQILSSLSYPMVILSTSILAVVFMITFVVPMFSDIFSRFGSDLPYITKVFINSSEFLKSNVLWIGAVLSSLVFLLAIVWNNTGFKKRLQYVLIKIPYIKDLIKGVYLSRFCSSMALLTSAKVPLLHAIQLAKKMIEFYPISIPLNQIESDIMRGETLHSCLSKDEIFDKKMISLVKVGENVNSLELFFDKLYQNYTEEVNMKTNVFNTFLEPFIIIFLGLIIGVMLVAMYLPMFQLSTSFG